MESEWKDRLALDPLQAVQMVHRLPTLAAAAGEADTILARFHSSGMLWHWLATHEMPLGCQLPCISWPHINCHASVGTHTHIRCTLNPCECTPHPGFWCLLHALPMIT